MKFLAVFLLAGLAIASAVPLFHDDYENELDQIIDELGDEFVVYAEGGLVARLRQRFEELLERLKKGVDEGKGVDRDLFGKADEFYKKLKNMGVELGEKIKQLLEDFRSRLGGSSPQFALDWKERLRQIRDRLKEHEFDEEKIREFVERVLGKSEVTNQILERLKSGGEKGKQRIIDFINRILGEEQVASSPQFALDWKERLRQIRDRLKEHEFDEAKIREFVERVLGKSEVTNQILERLKSGGEKGKQRIIDFINRILGEEQVASSPQFALDWKERLRQIRDRLKEHEFDEAKIRDFVERVLGKSEVTNQILEVLKTRGEKGKQRIIDFINRILGEEQVASSPQFALDWKERLRKLRNKLIDHKFDAAEFREFIENVVGNTELANQLLEKLMSGGEKGRQAIIDFINKVLGENRKASSSQFALDWKERLRQIRDRLKEHEFDEAKIREYVERVLGKSELTNQILERLKTGGEKGKQRLIDFINRILGENQVAFSIADKMKERFEEMLEKMQKSLEEGKTVSKNMWKKAEDTYAKLENLGVEFSEKIKQIFENIKSKMGQSAPQHAIVSRIKERLQNLISRMHKDMEDGKGVRGDLMKKLTDAFEKFKGLGGEMNQKFKDMFENLRKKFDKSSPVQQSVKEIYEKVKKFFRDLNIELKEKFTKFGEYVKDQYHKGLDNTKSKVENVRDIARKFVEDSRQISKDLAEEAQEFFHQYKDDLGHVYKDVVDKVRDILNRKD